MRSAKALSILILLGAGLSACALSRSVVEIKAPASSTVEGKVAAKITEVRDLRRFETNPPNPSMPSLGDAKEVQDPAVTSRAIGRKRNGYGMAMGDIMLPENTNVATLVRTAARRALQDKGYRVVEAGSPEFNTALPLAVDIEQFWAWVTPGVFEASMDFDSRTTLTGPMVLPSPSTVSGKYHKGIGIAPDSYWIESVQGGVDDLIEKMKAALKPSS